MVPRVHVANEALPEEGWRHKPADADLNHELRSTRSWHVGERSGLVARGREEWLGGTWERGVACWHVGERSGRVPQFEHRSRIRDHDCGGTAKYAKESVNVWEEDGRDQGGAH